MRNLFHAWFHVSRFQFLKRRAKIHAWRVRQLRFQEVIESATAAALKHDTHSLFQIINKFSPKQPMRRMQLRNQQGQIASPPEETAMLRHFIQETWKGPKIFDTPDAYIPDLPFSQADLLHALSQMPAIKAVARPCAPAIVWKSIAPQIAPTLYEVLRKWWIGEQPFIPKWFKDSWMILIPKPHKPPVHPRALRPLALQEPLGKSVVGLLASQAQVALMPIITPWPIWSYLPSRSTQDALLRVTMHCRDIRKLLIGQRSTPFTREQKTARFKIAGGISIFLDIERAFDMVCRPQLFSKLVTLGIPESVAHLLTQWHQDTCYHLFSQGIDEGISVGRGLRQGCKAAPLLWNSYLLLFLQALSDRVDRQWIQRCINFYADDGQLGDVFHSAFDFHVLLSNLYITLEVLQEFGMTINSSKCTALVAMTGTSHRQLRQSIIAFREGKEWLKLAFDDKPIIWIPVAKKVKYLGTVMSYHDFENHTTLHRIQLSKIAFQRLSRWLKSRRGLSQDQRIKLWTTCVYPVLTYSICTVGITPLGLQKLQQTMYSMLRQIIGNHAYITGQSHQTALNSQGVDLPLTRLGQTAERQLLSATQRLMHVDFQDIVHTLDWGHLHELIEFLHAQQLTGPAVPVSSDPACALQPVPVLTCRMCGFCTTNVAVFRQHCTQVHGHRMNRVHFASHVEHMINGLPHCKHGHKTFTTWRAFHTHIQRGCQVLQAGPPECWQNAAAQLQVDPPKAAEMFAPKTEGPVRGQTMLSDDDLCNLRSQEWGDRILTIVANKAWHHMKREQQACEYLAQRCCLCDQFLGRMQDLNQHIKVMHPQFWPHTSAKGKQLTNQYGEDTPCPFCHALFRNTHQCTVWTQLALLLVHGAGQVTDNAEVAKTILTCDICGTLHETPEALHAHLAQDHRLASTSFNPARDCLDGQAACNHCGALFEHQESLRSHINQGRCGHFDPDLPTEVLAVQPTWELATCAGKLADTLRDSHVRLQLTLQCQNCKCRYARPADLSGHLLAAHPQLWSASQGLTAILVSLLYNQVGCCCNPCTTQYRANHICNPLRQLAMQHLRLENVLFYPHDPTETELAQLMSTKLSRDTRFRLERLLTNRLLHQLWLDDDVLAITRSTCLLCAAELHVAELALHMYEAHQCGIPLVKFLVQQLLPKFLTQCDSDVQCYACHQVINLHREDAHAPSMPDAQRAAMVQAHYKAQCPCLIQAAVLLSRAANGRHGHAGRRGSHDSNMASVPGDGTHAGQDTAAVPECPSQAPKKRRLQPRRSPKTGGIRQNPAGTGGDSHGQIGTADGQGPPGNEERGHLHSLFRQQRERKQSADAAAGDREMGQAIPGDTECTPEGNNHASTPAPSPSPVQHAPQQDPATGLSDGWIRGHVGGSAQPGIVAGPHLPIPGMGSWKEDTGDQQQTPSHPDQNPADLPRHAGGFDGGADCGEISCTASRAETRGLPMETAGEPTTGQPLATADGTEPFSHLATHGDITTATQPSTKPPCSEPSEGLAASDIPQREWQGQEARNSDTQEGVNTVVMPCGPAPDLLLLKLAHMTMENPGNICFANATTVDHSVHHEVEESMGKTVPDVA